jgi:hypothetical protein
VGNRTRSGPTAAGCSPHGNDCRTRTSQRCGMRSSEEDPTAQILSAYIAKEELRTLLSTVRAGGDPYLTPHRLHTLLTWCIDSTIPELLTLARTIEHGDRRSMRSSPPASPTRAPRATTG